MSDLSLGPRIWVLPTLEDSQATFGSVFSDSQQVLQTLREKPCPSSGQEATASVLANGGPYPSHLTLPTPALPVSLPVGQDDDGDPHF